MTTELMVFQDNQIVVEQGTVTFNGYERLKEEALRLSEQVSQLEVTDENVQVSKKLLAAVNKRVKEMEDRRISIKKEILQPYTEFETQVKEIVSIVKDADGVVRKQVKDLEEIERTEKEDKLKALFEKRIRHYSFKETFSYEDFSKPQHLNKSVSIKFVESEMVDWLEKKDADMKVIQSLPNHQDVLMEYLDTKDLSVAINIVNDRETRKQELAKKAPVTKVTKQSVNESFIITLTDKKDLALVEMFMQQNEINYKSEKVAN